MESLVYKIDGVLNNVLSMPLTGASIKNDNGMTIDSAGRWWCPKCAVMVDTDSVGIVSCPYVMPMGVVVVKRKPTPQKISTKTHEGISESLMLKTIALLTNKETLDNLI